VSACNHDVDWDERSDGYGVCKRCGVTVMLCDDCGHPEDDCICWYLAEIAAGKRDDPAV
jgi:hypothetical protein